MRSEGVRKGLNSTDRTIVSAINQIRSWSFARRQAFCGVRGWKKKEEGVEEILSRGLT